MAQQGATLSFLGGAGGVTGSKFLVESGGRRLLLDCGMFQGLKPLRLRNWAPLPFDARALEAVVLSHAHLDHSGALPLLARAGFAGPVHCTRGSADLLPLVLLDAAHLQEEDAARANRYRYSKHAPALPLYTTDDAKAALALVTPHDYGAPFELPGLGRVTFRRAGHILGSATVELALERPGRPPLLLVHTGDLGRYGRPILRDPEPVPRADVLLVESTYGDRAHATDAEETLARVVTETAARGGAVVVPAFAIGRTQELLYTLRKLEDAGRLPLVSVYVDSPMAVDVTGLYCKHPEDHDLAMRTLQDTQRCPLCSHHFHLVRSVDESKALNGRVGPLVIIAASGMASGGRVLHHLKRRLPEARNTVLLVGYQAAGTRGRALQEGARTVRIHGEDVPVRAHVETLEGLSAHADQEDLLRWMRQLARPPEQVWVVHGEPGPAQALALAVRERLGWRADVAQDGARVALPR